MFSVLKKSTLAALAGIAILLPGCGAQTIRIDSANADSCWDQARYFQAQGRYELAREHFLLALAAARTGAERDALDEELRTVDLQIKTLR